MPFVILDAAGEPLRDHDGVLIVLQTEHGTEKWLSPGQRVRPFDPVKDRPNRRRAR